MELLHTLEFWGRGIRMRSAGLALTVLLALAATASDSPVLARSNFQGTPAVTIRATVPTAFEDATSARSSLVTTTSGEGVFTITRTGATTAPLDVHLQISGSATNGSDYQPIPNVVTIPAGASSVDVRVTPINDTEVESDETVTIGLADAPIPSTLNGTLASVVIKDNDTVVQITTADAAGSEAGSHPIRFTITRVGNVRAQLTVNYAVNQSNNLRQIGLADGSVRTISSGSTGVADGSVRTVSGSSIRDGSSNTIAVGESGTSSTSALATSGVDFIALPGRITFRLGQSSVALTVTPIDDTLPEGTESVTVTLLRNQLYTVGANASATGFIQDNDQPAAAPPPPPATVSLSATAANASEDGPTNGTVTVTRSGGSLSTPLTVAYSVNDTSAGNIPQPATNGVDFEQLSGQLTIPAGATSSVITIRPIADGINEPNERVVLRLLPAPAGQSYNIQPGSDSATVTIRDAHGNPH
jgi:Calx-beta domain